MPNLVVEHILQRTRKPYDIKKDKYTRYKIIGYTPDAHYSDTMLFYIGDIVKVSVNITETCYNRRTESCKNVYGCHTPNQGNVIYRIHDQSMRKSKICNYILERV